jgi:hypothetical protein
VIAAQELSESRRQIPRLLATAKGLSVEERAAGQPETVAGVGKFGGPSGEIERQSEAGEDRPLMERCTS